jgi:hypothetical protein
VWGCQPHAQPPTWMTVFIQLAPLLSSRGWEDPVPDPLLIGKSGSTVNRKQDLYICSKELCPLDHRGDHTSHLKYRITLPVRLGQFRQPASAITVHCDTVHCTSECLGTDRNCKKNRVLPLKVEIPYLHFACKKFPLMTSCHRWGSPTPYQLGRRSSGISLIRWMIKPQSWLPVCLRDLTLYKQWREKLTWRSSAVLARSWSRTSAEWRFTLLEPAVLPRNS